MFPWLLFMHGNTLLSSINSVKYYANIQNHDVSHIALSNNLKMNSTGFKTIGETIMTNSIL